MMNKSTVAVCLVVVMLCMVMGSAAAEDGSEGAAPVYTDYGMPDLEGLDNESDVYFAHRTCLLINEVKSTYKYKSEFAWTRLIIDMEVVPAYAFIGAGMNEIVLTEKVKRVEAYAFADLTDIRSVTSVPGCEAVIEDHAFAGSDPLLIDLRYNGGIGENAFDSDCSAYLVDDGVNTPDIPHGNIVDISAIDTEDILYIRSDFIPNNPDYLGFIYLGQGIVEATVDGVAGRTVTEIRTDGELYKFYAFEGKDIVVNYRGIPVEYEGLDQESAILRLDRYEIPLLDPESPYSEYITGWRETSTGTDLGTTLDRDEFKALGVTSLSLEPNIEGYTVSFDVSGLPGTETVPDLGDLEGGIASVYPEGESEHYVIAGWEIGGTVLEPGDPITMWEDHTATAVWEAKDGCTYEVRYLNADGTPTGVSVAVDHGRTATVPELTPGGIEAMQTTDGWLVNGAGDPLGAGDSFVVTGPTDMVPSVRDRFRFTVSFVADGKEFASATAVEGIPMTIAAGTPTDALRVFTGWSAPEIEGLLTDGDSVTFSGDSVLTAQWRDKETYTVTYATDDGPVGDPVTALEGDVISLDRTIPGDWWFWGWSDGSAEYEVGSSYTVTGDVTMSAVFRQPPDVTLTVGVWDGEPAVFVVTQGDCVTLDVDPGDRPGYDFLGWSADPEGEAAYARGASVQVVEDTTLYAVWSEIPTFTATFVTGTGEDVMRSGLRDTSVTIDVEPGKRYGYDFVGWSYTEGGTADLSQGDTITLTADVVLYAVWSEIPTYTVTFVTGTGEDVVRSGLRDSTVTIDVDPGDRYGYDFVGWSYTEGGPVDLDQGGSITLTADVALYAVWSEIPTYTVTFITGNGEDIVRSGLRDTRVAMDIDPGIRDGFDFVGWSYTEGGDAVLFVGDSVTLTSDIILYAVWSDIPTFSVTFVTGTGDPVTRTGLRDSQIVIDVDPGERYGYDFGGWSDVEGGSAVYASGDRLTLASDLTLYAVWAEIPSYTVSFVDRGEVVATETRLEGGSLDIGDLPLEREGFRFIGWSDISDGDVQYGTGDVLTVTSDITLYAVWAEEETVTITFVSPGTEVVRTATAGSPYTVDVVPEGIEGLTFAGWYESPGGDDLYAVGSVIVPTSDVTMVALWEVPGTPWEDWYDRGYGDGYDDGSDSGYDSGYSDGYEAGLGDGTESGFDQGYEQGYVDGTGDGYDSGYQSGLNDGAGTGYDEGYAAGLQDGRGSGYDQGYDQGYSEGYEAGFGDGTESGFDQGYGGGYGDGYSEGYDAGLEDGTGSGYEHGYGDGYDDGYMAGLEDMEGSGYDQGYDQGYSDSSGDGYSEGYADGKDAGYDHGYADGSDSGYGSGYSDGYDAGLADGTGTGYDQGFEQGYAQGHGDGSSSGYSEGYEAGLEDGKASGIEDGFDLGYDQGYADGIGSGYDSGYSDGYDTGLENGKGSGYDQGYADGSASGYDDGYESGLMDGISSGYDSGYSDGYDAGLADCTGSCYDQGYGDGYDEGYMAGLEDGKGSGYDQGYADGSASGYNEGYDDGYMDGYKYGRQSVSGSSGGSGGCDQGYDEGYDDGRDAGYDEGYGQGYAEGFEDGLLEGGSGSGGETDDPQEDDDPVGSGSDGDGAGDAGTTDDGDTAGGQTETSGRGGIGLAAIVAAVGVIALLVCLLAVAARRG